MTNSAIIQRLLFVLIFCSVSLRGFAQDNTLQAGDPPLADNISVTTIDDLTVNVVGEEGAVFGAAGVIVRNLYTGATETTIALGSGAFEVAIIGTDNMPYQVNAIQTLPQDIPDVLGGVGTIIYPDYGNLREGRPISFGAGGQVSYGANVWFTDGEINQLNFNASDDFSLTMDVRLFAPDADLTLPYNMHGKIALRRLFDENGRQLSTAIGTGDDWSSELTPTGLPILGRHIPDTPLVEAETDNLRIDEETGEIMFTFSFETTIPDDLAAGLYAPVFTGQASIADSEPFDWYANRVFSTANDSIAGDSTTILGLPLEIGAVDPIRIALNVFGKVSNEDSNIGLRSLPTGTMDNDPVLSTAIVPSTPDVFRPELIGWQGYIPLNSGQMGLRLLDEVNENVTLRDAQVIIENNIYQISGLEDEFETQFIELSGSLRDAFGRQYAVGGEYRILGADNIIKISPTILQGTPFVVGDRIPLTAYVFPPESGTAVHASASSAFLFRTFPNPFGYFGASPSSPIGDYSPVTATGIGEIGNQFIARYEDDVSGLWAGQQHTISFVASFNSANGVMGLADYDRNNQAWFDTRAYPADAADIPGFVNFPYFQGDVVYIPDGEDFGLNPVLTGGDYQYLSIVRPDVSVRQFVRDSEATFDARVSNDDLLGGQIGAGREGNRPNDVMFLFGGTASGDDIRGYSALAVVTDEDYARVVPPFTEPLFTIQEEAVYMFVLPTGVRPGQVLEVGDQFAHVGYVAPTVAADVSTEIVTPSGEVIQNTTQASTFGYFYDPSHDFTVSEAGVYRVYTQASYNGVTSAGQLADTFTGHPLGAEEYFVFVVPEDEPMLTTPRDAISTVVSGEIFTINVRAPEGWTDVQAYYTVRTASTILEQGTLDTFANQTNYQFNWPQIARIFPNIEANATDPSDMDEITFSFAFTGRDANGKPQIRARIFTLRGNTLYTFGA